MKTRILLILCLVGLAYGSKVFIPKALTLISMNTVSSTTCRVSHSCNGSSTDFDFEFPIIETDDLVVIHRVNSTGVETVLTETTNYSVAATNNDFSSGGTVTTVETYASGITLVLLRNTDMTQEADLEDSGVLRLETLEDEYDKLTMIVQEIQEELNRCLKYPKSDSSDLSAELPNSVDRTSTTLIFDANSEPDVE
jgi:hypothetical protein